MGHSHHTGQQQPGRRYFAAVVGFLVLMIGLLWGGQTWRVAYVVETIEARRDEAAREVLAHIDDAFAKVQEDLLAQAKRLAESEEVVASLRLHNQGMSATGSDALVRHFAALSLSKRRSVELYDTSSSLIAWNNFNFPLDAAPLDPFSVEPFQMHVATDEDWRQALVVWYPVRDEARTLGVVRAMHLLYVRTPVQNQYLRDFDIVRDWYREKEFTVTVRFGASLPDSASLPGPTRLLRGRDNAVLGQVIVALPPAERFVSTVRARFNDVLAFWATLLLFWVVAGLWFWYRRAEAGRARTDHTTGHPFGRFAVVALAWWGMRYALLALDVPARWQRGKAPLSPLFDPQHLASMMGGGLMRSSGDFLITALFAIFFSLAVLSFATRFRLRDAEGLRLNGAGTGRKGASVAVFFLGVALNVLLAFGLWLVLALVTRRTILDSTLDYFAREGLLPTPLVLVVFCSLLLSAMAVLGLMVSVTWIGLSVHLRHWPSTWPRWARLLGLVLAGLGSPLLLYVTLDLQAIAPWSMAPVFLGTALGLALAGFVWRGNSLELLTLRGVLPAIFVLSLLLYPLFYSGMQQQQAMRIEDAADAFDEGRDPRAFFAIEQVLGDVQGEPTVAKALMSSNKGRQARLDSLALLLLRNSLLPSLGAYDVSLVFMDTTGQPVGRYDAVDQSVGRAMLNQLDAEQFDILQQMYAERGQGGPMVEQVTGFRETDRFQYEGIAPIYLGEQAIGWALARAMPQTLTRDVRTPFPRVLGYGDVYGNVSLAEFHDQVLVRSLGRDFGRYRLDEAVWEDLRSTSEVWHRETAEEKRFLTYYRRQPAEATSSPVTAPGTTHIVAVRVSALSTFDHLYYLLRLTVAGFFVGLPFYVMGLYLRRRAGLLPAPRVRFRNKVLNAFLVVGIVAISAVGFLGLQVVTGENERAVQNWLEQHLERVVETLSLEAEAGERPYRVLDRLRLDSLAVRVRLDLNLFSGQALVASSRPQLVGERLIDKRLPIEAYQALYLDGYEFTFVDEQLGTFAYTAGYGALLDEQGQPHYVLSVPTSPEQERIEEERARTVAYLFGALLLLVIVVMLTASLLANALARPIARLRVGLEDVAKGRFERVLPVDTRDEIGELVATFNVMQEQLADSRRQLAQQERQLAWREMARQVAHEIKNPLTPMKLSVQHLRRAYQEGGSQNGDPPAPFTRLFERITSTLVEQIDTLARIANEFSTYARMPTQVLERLDLNVVIREAASLMEAEANVELVVDLHPEPLVLEADREELRRSYINLIKNALQAIPPGQAGQVTLTSKPDVAQQGRRWAYSTVADTGTGISPELRSKIFEPNFSTKTSGAGLGLAIIKKSIEEIGGKIGFETEEGVGTLFWIQVPLVD